MGSCANTILLDFSVHPSYLTDEGNFNLTLIVEAHYSLLLPHYFLPSGFQKLEKEIVSELEKHMGVNSLVKLLGKMISPIGDNLSIYSGPRLSVINFRTFPNGLVTINIDYFMEEGAQPLLTLEESRGLELAWGTLGNKFKSVTLPAIKRGTPFDIYFLSSDERIMEYDIDQVIYDDRSPFQHIQILHSNTFGNMLVLDDLQNLAESDLIYTESIMCRGIENYKDKEILILGGGDGALLNELRKEQPKHITMVEIDEMVMQICKVYLRPACGDTLDTYKGENYDIVVGDCMLYMDNCKKEGKTFDYVIADLTDIPISPTPQGELWDFIKKILNMSFSVLNSNGKYFTHGNGSSSPKALKMFEDVLDQLDIPVTFTRTHAFVPSFLEDWVFYQIQRKKV
ncbi:Spermine synthase [Orchesella cincta]|uniref:Spermine synthase n=1 Tax=Orchesella cincta TaxID=48709 RepID=A0A1D2MIT7_ORCCI|nr:Spermine synthase [Orchesella cincta]